MKKITILILGIISHYSVFSQNYEITQTVKTPYKTTVPDTYYVTNGQNVTFSAYEMSVIENHLYNNYGGATIVGDQDYRYNCHAYAWHVSEGGDLVWMGRFTDSAEDTYWNDGSYIEVSENEATKVSYHVSGNHSAIKEGGVWYRSKWGSSFLVRHKLNEVLRGDIFPYLENSNYHPELQKKFYRRAKIAGESIPQSPSIYYVESLPSTLSANWTYTPKSGTSLPPGSFITNNPTANQCTINNSSKQYINGTLKATITKSGTTIATLEKEIRSGDGFSATCSQPFGQVVPVSGNVTSNSSTLVTFMDNAAFSVKKSSNGSYPVTITSPYFSNATITHTSITGLSWNKSGNTITISYPANNLLDPPLVVTGNSSTDYRVFRFSIYSQLDIPLQLTSEVQGRSVKLALVPDEEAAKDYSVEALACFTNELAGREWDVTVSNAMTGKIVYESHTTGASLEIIATEWTPGIYVIKACVANQVLTQKIVVN